MGLNARLERSYRSQKGNVTFVYKVTGNPTDLASYKEAQGEYFREDEDGTALWFTTRCIGDVGSLIITSKGKVVPDMSKFDQAASIVEQYGGNFGEALAGQAVANLLGGNTAPQAQPTQDIPHKEIEAGSDDLGDV